MYSRQGAFRGSENARPRGRAECFRAVYGYKPADAPCPPFPLRNIRNKRRGQQKNISVKLKYQFISLAKRKVKAQKPKAQS